MSQQIGKRNGLLLVITAAIMAGLGMGCEAQQRRSTLPAPRVHRVRVYQPATPPSVPVVPVASVRTNGHALSGRSIVVDPGHGGKDPGTLGCEVAKVPEKSIVLDVAMHVMDLLQSRGARVWATRTDDRFIELDDRALLADRTRTDLLVSIHADAHDDQSMTGATLYVARAASQQSIHAAESIRAALHREGIACNGIRRANFRVLAKHSQPAVLVECGYMTNPTEAMRLQDGSYRRRIATAIATGVETHLSR